MAPSSWTEAKILTLVCNFLAMNKGSIDFHTEKESGSRSARHCRTDDKREGSILMMGLHPNFVSRVRPILTPTQLMQPFDSTISRLIVPNHHCLGQIRWSG